MQTQVFDFLDYREFLRQVLPTTGSDRGQRTRLAALLGCRNSFVSSVLTSKEHFSAEHALRACQFLQLSTEETDFFLLIHAYGRAGSKDLEAHYRAKIDAVLLRRREVRARISETEVLSEAARLTYYSSWHYIAAHMCLMIPSLRSRRAIAQHLDIAPEHAERIIQFFLQNRMAVEEGGELRAEPFRLHLPGDSPLVAKHHVNWRMKAIQSLDHVGANDLHYSLVMSVSEEAAQQIRAILLKGIQDTEPVLKAARDEALYALNVDLFRV